MSLTINYFIHDSQSPELEEFLHWPIRKELLGGGAIGIILMCFKEIEFPEELETLIINSFGPALKILRYFRHDHLANEGDNGEDSNEEADDSSLRPTKKRRTYEPEPNSDL